MKAQQEQVHERIEALWVPPKETPKSSKNRANAQLHHLLSQLSFEHPIVLDPPRQEEEEDDTAAETVNDNTNDTAKRNKKKKRKKKRRKQYLVFGTRLHSDDSDVYFDALEQRTATLQSTPSLVLSDVTVSQGRNGESSIELCLGESSSSSSSDDDGIAMLYPPKAPTELPLRFLRAGKNDPVVGMERYKQTLEIRQQQKLDTILFEGNEQFDVIKQYYPHYFHGFGKNGQPCFYEQPPRTNLAQLRHHGISLERLLRHYMFVTEFQWQYLCPDDTQSSIYIIDLKGIRMTDFMGEAVDFMKQAASFSSAHYPERAGLVYVGRFLIVLCLFWYDGDSDTYIFLFLFITLVNVPGWFKIIWNVVKPLVDEATLSKIFILKTPQEILEKLRCHIDMDTIPQEYGGDGGPLGSSAEEQKMASLVAHNTEKKRCGVCTREDCEWCQWAPVRSY